MKNFKFLFSVAAISAFVGIQAPSAQAVYRPGWERPIADSDMFIRQSAPPFERAERLHVLMAKVDGWMPTTVLTVTIDNQKPLKFHVGTGKVLDCQHVEYTGQVTLADGQEAMLKFRDESRNTCPVPMDKIIAPWNLEMKLPGSEKIVLEAYGSPSPIYTIQ